MDSNLEKKKFSQVFKFLSRGKVEYGEEKVLEEQILLLFQLLRTFKRLSLFYLFSSFFITERFVSQI